MSFIEKLKTEIALRIDPIVLMVVLGGFVSAATWLAQISAQTEPITPPIDRCPNNPNVLCLTSEDLTQLTISGENNTALTGFRDAIQLGDIDQAQSQAFFEHGLGLKTPFNPFSYENNVGQDWILPPKQEIELPVTQNTQDDFTVKIPGNAANPEGYQVDAASFLGMMELLKSLEANDIPPDAELKGELPDHTKVFVSPSPNNDGTYNAYFFFPPVTEKPRDPNDLCSIVKDHKTSCKRAAEGDIVRGNTIQPEGKSGFVWMLPATLDQFGNIISLNVVDPAYPNIKINISYDELKHLIENTAPQITNLSVDQGRVMLPLGCLGIVAALVLFTPIGLGLKHILFAESIEEAAYGKRALSYGAKVANSMLQNSAQVVYRVGAGIAGFVGANALNEASRINSLGYLLPDSQDPNIKSIQALLTMASLLTIFKRPVLHQIATRMAKTEHSLIDETYASELLYGHIETKFGPLFPASEIFFTTALLSIIPQLINGISAEQLWNSYSNVAHVILGFTGGITALSWGLTSIDLIREYVKNNRFLYNNNIDIH